MNPFEKLEADLHAAQLAVGQLRVDLACAIEALNAVVWAYSASDARRIAQGFLHEYVRRLPCVECGDSAEFFCRDGTTGCYGCANNAGDGE